jgi:hypothetical protein
MFRASKQSEEIVLHHISEMSQVANEKFSRYQLIWVKFDQIAIIFALMTGLCAIVIQLSVSNINVPLKIEYPALTWLTISIYVAGITSAIDLDFAAVLVCFISVLQA